MTRCIVCGQTRIKPLIDLGKQPLSVISLPKSEAAAKTAKQHPLNFVMCLSCGHVFNKDFDPDAVPYTEDSCHMYNQGAGWQTHIANVIDKLKAHTFNTGGPLIDIGCGDGSFFTAMKKRFPDCEYIGFEPGPEVDLIKDFTAVKDYFIPERDLKLYNPSLICLRHVMEHLPQPQEFLAEIAYWSTMYGQWPMLLVEVPCFNKAMKLGRVGDLIYEHISHYTYTSSAALIERAGFTTQIQYSMYDDEVLVEIAKRTPALMPWCADRANKFTALANKTYTNLDQALERLDSSIALWGSTGKSAGFINTYKLDATRFPLVVDSDPAKCGKFVPGTGQKIKHSTYLLDNPVDVILITTHWRAKDIYQEIKELQIPHKRVVYLNGSELVDYKE